ASGNVEAKVVCFYRRRDISNTLIMLADKHAKETEEETEMTVEADLTEKQKHQLKHRELFLSRQYESLPATHIRGKCSVALLNETESVLSYLDKEDTFFYSLVYDPSVKTLLADKGEIRVGPKYQADIPDVLPEGDSDEREQSKLEVKVWDPNSPLTDRQIDQFLVVARAVGTFARALDCSSSVRQPSLHMSAAAASRDITLVRCYSFAALVIISHATDAGFSELSDSWPRTTKLIQAATQSHQWYSWGPPNMQCRLCATCWLYWKKYGGLKMPTQSEEQKSPSPTAEDPRVRSHLSRQAMQGMPVRNTGSPKSAVKTRQAFFLHTTYFTKIARQVCKNTLRLRQAARRPFVAINYAAIRAEYADRHAELSGSPLKSKSTRKPLSCIIGYLEIHPAKKPNVIRSPPSLQTPTTKRMLTTPNHTSLSILGKRNYSHHNGLDGMAATRGGVLSSQLAAALARDPAHRDASPNPRAQAAPSRTLDTRTLARQNGGPENPEPGNKSVSCHWSMPKETQIVQQLKDREDHHWAPGRTTTEEYCSVLHKPQEYMPPAWRECGHAGPQAAALEIVTYTQEAFELDLEERLEHKEGLLSARSVAVCSETIPKEKQEARLDVCSLRGEAPNVNS
ncbi:Metastasis-associated protein MTA3, partial [Microtus ochrogaster]